MYEKGETGSPIIALNAVLAAYFLFFATKNRKGIQKMKEAMWRVDESGSFRFSDATAGQLALPFTKEPDFAALKRDIVGHFTGQVTVGDVEEFVLVDTPFHTTTRGPSSSWNAMEALPPSSRSPDAGQAPSRNRR